MKLFLNCFSLSPLLIKIDFPPGLWFPLNHREHPPIKSKCFQILQNPITKYIDKNHHTEISQIANLYLYLSQTTRYDDPRTTKHDAVGYWQFWSTVIILRDSWDSVPTCFRFGICDSVHRHPVGLDCLATIGILVLVHLSKVEPVNIRSVDLDFYSLVIKILLELALKP